MFKKYLSYLFPIKLESEIAQDNVPLEVYYDQGKIKLFTKTTNYSGGKLKSMFRKALKHEDFKEKDHVLILGFGLGSIWEIIKSEKKQNPYIHGVDYEPLMKTFIRTYSPNILKDSKTHLYINDALTYLRMDEQRYDYILIDLFCDNNVADIVLEPEFIDELFKHSHIKTSIIINTMYVPHEKLKGYLKYFEVITSNKIEKSNKVYYLRPFEG